MKPEIMQLRLRQLASKPSFRFLGIQKGLGAMEGFALYNLVMLDHPAHLSTLSVATIDKTFGKIGLDKRAKSGYKKICFNGR